MKHEQRIEAWTMSKVCPKFTIESPEQYFTCWLWTDFTIVLEDRNNGCRVSYLNDSEYNCTVSTKMYYVLPTKTIQGSSAVVRLFFKKRCSRICFKSYIDILTKSF